MWVYPWSGPGGSPHHICYSLFSQGQDQVAWWSCCYCGCLVLLLRLLPSSAAAAACPDPSFLLLLLLHLPACRQRD